MHAAIAALMSADIAKRLRIIVLAKRSDTAREVATRTGFSRRVVQAWVARYNGEGLAGLETKAGFGNSFRQVTAQSRGA